MGEIVLARVDERLIHGQVLGLVAKSTGADTIYIVDDEVVKDDFMVSIYGGSAKQRGFDFAAYSVDRVIEEWNKSQFNDSRVLVLAKTIEPIAEMVSAGLPIKRINVANMSPRKDSVSIINTVNMTPHQGELLRDMVDEKNIHVYFQSTPNSSSTSFKDGIRKIK